MWLLSDRDAEIERLRQAAAEQAEQLVEARREIEIAVLERESARLKTALAHERKQLAEAKKLAEAKTRAAKPAAPPTEQELVTAPGLQTPSKPSRTEGMKILYTIIDVLVLSTLFGAVFYLFGAVVYLSVMWLS